MRDLQAIWPFLNTTSIKMCEKYKRYHETKVEHKTSHRGTFFDIEMYASSER